MVAAGVVATIDPEELLWTPGKKKIFVPPPAKTPRGYVHVTQRTVAIAYTEDAWSERQLTIADAKDFDAMVAQLRTLPGPNRVISAWGERKKA